jgi:hypothetical protein
MKPEASSPCSQQPTTGPYSEPDESISLFILFLESFFFNILFLGFASGIQ